MKMLSPLIVFPETDGRTAIDVVLKRSQHDFNLRARDPKDFLEDHELVTKIIGETHARIDWINSILEKDGEDFYTCFSNAEKFDSLTALKPKRLDENVLRERMKRYKSRFEAGLILMGEVSNKERVR
jgi:hypothetical protein